MAVKKTDTPTMEFQRLNLDVIESADRNPKGHEFEELVKSVERFGFQGVVIMNAATGKIVAGHGRVEALRRYRDKHPGEPPPMGIIARGKGGSQWMVPAMMGWFEDDAEAEAYLLADNRLTELGAWDDGKQLASMLAELGDFSGTGFTPEDLTALEAELSGLKQIAPPSVSEGDVSTIGQRYEVVVECASEGDMEKVFEDMTGKGYQCRTLIL